MGNVEASSSAPQEDVKPEAKDFGRAGAVPDKSASSVGDVKETQEEGGDEERPGLIRPDGSINWDCPCLGGMANGPCGEEFKAAFSCFHYSTAEQKGSDCLEPFMAMQNCFQKYPEIFGPKEGEEEEDSLNDDPNDDETKKEVDGEKSPRKGRLNEPEKKSVQIK